MLLRWRGRHNPNPIPHPNWNACVGRHQSSLVKPRSRPMSVLMMASSRCVGAIVREASVKLNLNFVEFSSLWVQHAVMACSVREEGRLTCAPALLRRACRYDRGRTHSWRPEPGTQSVHHGLTSRCPDGTPRGSRQPCYALSCLYDKQT